MYEVSAGYLAAFRSHVHQKKIKGTVGSVSITQNNIQSGSLTIHNQCAESADIKLGAVYIGTLECTFLNNTGINRNSWKGKIITLEEGLLVGSSYQYIPKGKWQITEAEWNEQGTSVKAYDNMQKLVKPFPYTQISASTPIDILQMICDDCHVENGMEDLDDFCNGDSIIYMTEPGDIETYQDALYWLAQALCAFATIDRTGKLVLRRFVSDPVDIVQSTERFNNSSFSDYSTKYTGLSVIDMSDGTTKYYSAQTDDGSTINLGANPFLQSYTKDTLIQNILDEVQNIQYVPFSATMLDGALYDLGDVVEHQAGIAGQTSECIIMYFDDSYNRCYEMRGVGTNPEINSAKSKTDKSIQGLINNTSRNETSSYEAKNLKAITISDGHRVNIFSGILASNKDTKAMIHVEVNLETTANTPTDEYEIEVDDETMKGTLNLASIWQGITDAATKAEVTYLIDSEEANLHPIESYIDGRHVLHLMYILGLKQGIQTYFDILMRATGGTIKIARGGLWYYALGVGLVGDGKWDGTIKITEEAADFDLTLLGFDAAAETVTVSRPAPEVIPITQTAADFDLIQLTFETAAETITVTFHNDMEPRTTEDGEERITEDGEALYTEGE